MPPAPPHRGLALRLAALALVFAPAAAALGPGAYYDTVDATSSASLRTTLHDAIDDHQRFPYTSAATDTWDILELADQDPANPGRIVDVYRNASYAKQGGGNSFYNREHTWPNSYGYPNDNAGNYPYTDAHGLMLSNSGYNSARGNKPFGTCAPGCTEYVTDATNGSGGGSQSFPGNSNWANPQLWQVWRGRQGDIARALLYLDIRYEGGQHGVTGHAEPDLVLTDEMSLVQTTGGNTTGRAYMGRLSVLIAWHEADPVDEHERLRNAVVFSFQGNRNPFIDHPHWVACLHLGECAPADVLFAWGFED